MGLESGEREQSERGLIPTSEIGAADEAGGGWLEKETRLRRGTSIAAPIAPFAILGCPISIFLRLPTQGVRGDQGNNGQHSVRPINHSTSAPLPPCRRREDLVTALKQVNQVL